MNYILTALICAVVALGAWGYNAHKNVNTLLSEVRQWEEQGKRYDAALGILLAEASAADAAIKENAARKQSLNHQRKTDHGRLKDAVGANSDWGTTPVPDGVLDILSTSSSGSSTGTPSEHLDAALPAINPPN